MSTDQSSREEPPARRLKESTRTCADVSPSCSATKAANFEPMTSSAEGASPGPLDSGRWVGPPVSGPAGGRVDLFDFFGFDLFEVGG